MNARERLQTTLDHRQPDRPCVDLGGTPTTGIAASTLAALRRAVLGEDHARVKVIEPYQMLGEVEDDLREALGIDVIGVGGRKTFFGFENRDWKPLELFDGTPVLVPDDFNITEDDNGDWLMYPEGDLSAPPSARMPRDGYYFDTIIRQPPLDEDNLDPEDNLEEFAPLTDDQLADFGARAAAAAETGYGVILCLPGTGLGDIALVPAPFLKYPRGIRDVAEWYMSVATRQDYVHAVFERQTEIAVENIRRLAGAVGDHVQAAFVCGTDFGTQNAPFISPQTYKTMYSPYYRRINAAVHEHSGWKTFKHSCGSVRALIPDFIDDGFDILNPVQCSAADMDAVELKREFGRDVVFWGGAVDTQHTLPFGSSDEVYNQVRRRIDIFNDGGGFVFNTIHNIQAKTPIDNLLAMFRAIRDS